MVFKYSHCPWASEFFFYPLKRKDWRGGKRERVETV